jgi:hypothetical protein
LTPAFEELNNSCNPPAWQSYSYAPLFAMLAAIMMHCIETVASDYFTRKYSNSMKSQHVTIHTHLYQDQYTDIARDREGSHGILNRNDNHNIYNNTQSKSKSNSKSDDNDNSGTNNSIVEVGEVDNDFRNAFTNEMRLSNSSGNPNEGSDIELVKAGSVQQYWQPSAAIHPHTHDIQVDLNTHGSK